MTRHTKISYLKSGIRILGYSAAIVAYHPLLWAMVALIVAEGLGIAEEFGEDYGRKL